MSADGHGHIFSDVTRIIRYFGSFNIINPPQGDPAEANQTPVCAQMGS